MKKYLLSSLLALLLCSSMHAEVINEEPCCVIEEPGFCESKNFYVRGLYGPNLLSQRNNNVGYIASGSFGYRFNYGIRVEAEYAFRKNSYTKCSSYMLNGLFDIPIDYPCFLGQPYVGLGVGRDVRGVHWKFYDYSWQLIAGLDYPLFSRVDLCVEYKYHSFKSRISNHSLGFGVVCKFGLAVN